MNDIKKRLANLSPKQREQVLEKLRQQHLIPTANEIQAIPVISREQVIPLSFAQQRLWFIEKMALSSNAYNMLLTLHLVGKLDYVALQKSFNQIIARHETLRTTFGETNGTPVQIIKPNVQLELPKIDLSQLTPSEQSSQLQELLQKESEQLFNLEVDPPIRAQLFKLGATEHILHITLHHIVSDGWSLTVLPKDISAFYTAIVQDQPCLLPELPIQYADFAVWQRNYLQGETLEKQLSYWKQKLQDLPQLQLQLPTDYPRPPVQTFNGAGIPINIPAELTSKLRKLTQQQGTTLFMILLAGFKILLYRYSGQESIAVGSPIANRNRSEIEGLIGFFVNSLVMYTDLGGDPGFQEVLNRVKQTALEAYGHQDIPFEKLVEELQPERSLSQNPLFQVMFALQQEEFLKPSFNLPNLEVGWYEGTEVEMTVRMDMEFHLSLVGEEIKGICAYNRDLFEAETISRMLSHYQKLLSAAVETPERPISKLPLMTKPELDQILIEWNNTKTDYPDDKCIHQLFEEQVEKTPLSIAVVFEQQKLTYLELNSKANRLAYYLQKLGVTPKTLVGICVERSVEMVVGLLAILKAGGAYVPLDPNYPTSRLNYLVEDAQLSIILTQEKWQHHLPQTAVICLEAEIKTGSSENLTVSVTSEHQAYMMYTSGSTGKPKGVNIKHQGVVRLIKNTNYINLKEEDIFLQLAPISFDAATLEIWGSLLNGGTLAVMPAHQPSLGEIGAAIRENQVTTLWLTAGLFQLMVEEQLENLKPVKQLLAGGDVLSVTHVQKVLEKLPGCQLINGYGPTENTTFTCCFPVKADSNIEKSVPIGKPISNTQIYILDSNLQPVPIGVAGELHIGGDGLATGYHNRPELTAEKFITNPFDNSKVLYKTGDLARYLRDGNIEFLGRIDHQVKIRGFRIETGEIEAAFNSYSQVKETVVLAREDSPGEKRLVAYLVLEREKAEASETEQIGKLKQYLKELLPQYMLPSGYVVLPELPLTPNGKVDRKALPAPDWGSIVSTDYVAPETKTQKILAEILSEVLEVEKVGIYDNLFDLGGHSLMATKVASRIHQAFDIDLPLRSVFENLDVASLAQEVEISLAQSPGIEIEEIQPREEKDNPPPLSFAQQRLWFLEKMGLTSNTYNMPLTLHLVGQLDRVALEKSLNQIITRHESLRTTFGEINGTPVQLIKSDVELELPKTDLSQLTPSEQSSQLQQLLQTESEQLFNLEVDPPIRAQLFKLGATEHILHITLHHIVSDGWSLTVLPKDISAFYTAIVQDQPCLLPELPIQYADFAVWQRNYLQGETLEKQLSYWKQKLQDLPQLQLPTDYARPAVETFNGAGVPIYLPTTLTSKIQQLSQKQGATLFMTLLAAFKVLLSRYSGQEQIAVGSPIANRNRQEIEGLIGFFVNSLVMYTDLGGEPSFQEVLNRVKQTALEAYSHQDIPFEQLVEELQPERSLSKNPLFQVSFAVQQSEVLKPSFSLPNLEVDWYRGAGTEMTVRFDLELHLWPLEEQIAGSCAYNRDLFEVETISRMLSHYENLLSAAMENLELPISKLPLMTEVELEKLLVEWNNTKTDYPEDKCIHQLFEEQVERTPDAIAVVFENQKLTYQELNVKANQLAHYLQKLGVKPEVLVGIFYERSLEIVIGLLAILKAGGAYVPLDPTYPAQRLAYIIADTAVPVLLTTPALMKLIPENQAQVVCWEQDTEAIISQSTENPVSGVNLENIAYGIYTSGSTGKPKGVMIPHRAIYNHMMWMQGEFRFTSTDKVLQKTPFGFDASVWEFYAPLLVGAQLIIARPGGHKDTDYLVQVIKEQEITILQVVPTLLRMLLEHEHIGTCISLKRVFCGGEALAVELVEKFLNHLDVDLINLYGPTETCIDASFWSCKGSMEREMIPIGRPIANTQMYILDKHQQLAPVGVPGELHIAGSNLARGYLKQEELTQQKFISNPFSQSPGKLYKTGDLAKYLPDGNIEFLGRIDHQVKLRGFRIELAEIESAIGEHPGVEEVVVILTENQAGQQQLVGYLVPNYDKIEAKINQNKTNFDLSWHQVNSWQEVFNEISQEQAKISDSFFNIVGWHSSYDNQLIPESQMRVWAEDIVSQVLAKQPQKVWEVGCGTGMLLFQIAPHTQGYYGTDISNVSLEYIKKQIEQQPDKYAHVTLAQKRAEDMSDVADDSFDVVLLSSVVQYFPNLEYLVQVISNSIRVVKPGGALILGDIRSYPLMRAFHTSIELHKATPSLSIQQLRHGIDRQMQQESELLISPELFVALKEKYPEITHVQIRLQRGTELNELNKYRYSVLLHIQAQPKSVITAPVENGEGMSYEEIEAYLRQKQPESICFSNLVNSRVDNDVMAVELLPQAEPKQNVQQLRQQLQENSVSGIDPEQLHQLSESLGYKLELCWSAKGNVGSMDAVFVRSELAVEAMVLTPLTQQSILGMRWDSYVNNPLASMMGKKLIGQLREYLPQKLPEYMMPSGFMILPQIPLTPNGKVDRKGLPAPDFTSSLSTEYVAPETETQKALAEIWAELLGIEQIGIHDNFFDLGGHSLMATQVVSRIRHGFGIEITLQRLFESSTISGIAQSIEVLSQLAQDENTLIPETDEEYEEEEVL